MKKILNLILFIALTTFINAQDKGTSSPPKPRILGVVMGISKYQNVPSLRYADRDAMSFYNFLLSPSGGAADTNNIRLLLNEKATSYNFFEAMDNLLDMAKEGDQVYIYFAGHGDIEKKTDRQNGFLIGYNAPPNCYAAGGCISVKFLQDYVETLVANKKARVTVIIDACRSGKLAGGSQGNEITALALQAEWKGVTKILSCQPGETSLEGEQWGGGAGVFTYFMLKGMLGQADDNADGKVTAMELGTYLDKIVMKETLEKQIPEIVGDKRQEITRVNKQHALALLNQMERPILLTPEKQSAGFEADISSINDISVLKEYEKFKYYINNSNLIAYNDSEKDKGTAFSIYHSLEGSRSAQSIISKMKGELLAALQNKAQIMLNAWIESFSINDQQFINDAYQELNTAFSLADSSDPQYSQIKYRYLFMKSAFEEDSLKAIKILEECININPDEPFAYVEIGSEYSNKLNNHEKAISYFDKALELSNNWSIAWSNKGIALGKLGKYDDAIKCQDKALELKPDYETGWVTKGSNLQKIGKHEEAIKCYDKAIELNPNDSLAWYNSGFSYDKLMKNIDAIKCYDKAIELNPKYAEAWTNKGILLYQTGKTEDAMKHYNKAIEINPNLSQAWYNKGELLSNLKKYEEAISCCDTAIRIDPGGWQSYDLKAKILMKTGNSDKAIKCYDKAIEINTESAYVWYNKGIILNELGKWEEAIKCYDKAIEINPDFDEAWTNKGNALSNLKKIDEAIKSFDKAIEINPRRIEAWGNKGVILYNDGKHDEALKCFDKEIEVNPDLTNGWYNKGHILYYLGKSEEAIICYDKAIEINPNLAEAWTNKGTILSNLGKNEEAIKCCDKALEINSNSWEAYGLKGYIKHIQKRYDDAINCQNKVLELNPNNVSSIYNIACAYSLLKNKPEMLKYLKKAIELNPVQYKVDAPKDEDFKEYWNDPDFLELVK